MCYAAMRCTLLDVVAPQTASYAPEQLPALPKHPSASRVSLTLTTRGGGGVGAWKIDEDSYDRFFLLGGSYCNQHFIMVHVPPG